MARAPKDSQSSDAKPELKVMYFSVWEDDGAKVSVGVYPHMNEHWNALELADTATKQEIKAQFHKLSIKYHPDKNREDGATERYQKITDAYQALKDVDGELAFPWDKYPERQRMMTGEEALKELGHLGREVASAEPIKAQMMQHVVKESTECKILYHERESVEDGVQTNETWADGLCVDSRNGSNHLVKVYRWNVTLL